MRCVGVSAAPGRHARAVRDAWHVSDEGGDGTPWAPPAEQMAQRGVLPGIAAAGVAAAGSSVTRARAQHGELSEGAAALAVDQHCTANPKCVYEQRDQCSVSQ